jgi:nitrogen fixation/metabolism regulation signal transduction histidine kinase
MAQRNAFVFGAYALVFGIALVFGAYLALRFAQPVNALTKAARDVSRGNYDVHIKVRTRDEIGVLADSFNEMIDRIKKSRIELAKHERESAWKEMAKQIAHEIRNPLTPIKLSIQHLRQAFKDKAQNREEILERVSNTVVDQIDTLSRIASEFSSFAKLPEKKYEKLEVDQLLQETVDIFREVVGISFVLHLQTSSEMVIADRDQLKSVFINIIKNAIQSINKSGTITIESLFERDVYKIRISDTGHGIPSEILQKIFEPNFSTKSEGMGLGLAIARRVIEDHGGAIYCSSEIGKGTQFEINLPK